MNTACIRESTNAKSGSLKHCFGRHRLKLRQVSSGKETRCTPATPTSPHHTTLKPRTHIPCDRPACTHVISPAPHTIPNAKRAQNTRRAPPPSSPVCKAAHLNSLVCWVCGCAPSACAPPAECQTPHIQNTSTLSPAAFYN